MPRPLTWRSCQGASGAVAEIDDTRQAVLTSVEILALASTNSSSWLQVRCAVNGGRTQPEAAFSHSRAASILTACTARDGPAGLPSGAQLPASCQHWCLLLPMCGTMVLNSPTPLCSLAVHGDMQC